MAEASNEQAASAEPAGALTRHQKESLAFAAMMDDRFGGYIGPVDYDEILSIAKGAIAAAGSIGPPNKEDSSA